MTYGCSESRCNLDPLILFQSTVTYFGLFVRPKNSFINYWRRLQAKACFRVGYGCQRFGRYSQIAMFREHRGLQGRSSGHITLLLAFHRSGQNWLGVDRLQPAKKNVRTSHCNKKKDEKSFIINIKSLPSVDTHAVLE